MGWQLGFLSCFTWLKGAAVAHIRPSQGFRATVKTTNLNSKISSSLAIVLDRIQMDTTHGRSACLCAATMMVFTPRMTR
jgi:hypothetical protein